MAQQRLLKLDKDGKPFTGNDVGPNGELRYYKNGRLLEGIGGAAQMLQGGFEDFVEPLVDGGKNYWNRQTRLTKEALERDKKEVEPSSPSGISFQQALGYEPQGEMKSMFESVFSDLDTGFFSDQNETAYMNLKDIYGVVNQQQLTEDTQTFTNTPDPETYTTWDSETDKTETGTVGDKDWKADMRSPEEIAREEWESKSRNTPAAKAFEEGTGQQKKDWGDLRWEARKRHKKLFEYNTDKEK